MKNGVSISVKKRLLVVLMGFLFVLFVLVARILYIQVVMGSELQKKMTAQYNKDIDVNPKRGSILDRNLKQLAVTASAEKVQVNPSELKDSPKLEFIIENLSIILEIDKEAVRKIVTKSSSNEVLKSKIDKEIGNRVRQFKNENNISGIYVCDDVKRYYPNRNLAAHIIGFTGTDNQGLGGIELVMDKYLKGAKGKILSGTDSIGRELPYDVQTRIDPQDGLNVVLTIDETIQQIVNNVLDKAVLDCKLKNGAAAIVMDPSNGDILAMVSKPDFDLNNPFAPPLGINENEWNPKLNENIDMLQKTVWRNKAVVDTYEPGSTFKAITAAAGLEEKVISPDTMVTDATVTIGGWNINCWRPNAHGNETFAEGVYNSCNPVFVRLAQALGKDKFYKYVRAFGFYDKTGIILPGEEGGHFHENPNEVDMAVTSFGQRFTITPLQLITSYACIANGGKLLKPRIVKEIVDNEGNVVKKYEPEVVRNVISKDTSQTLLSILEGVVSKGTGRNAYVEGYRIAGKTGTSETNEKEHYIASFSAIAPADNPKICVLVVLDYPQVDPHTGGVIAAPLAGRIVDEVLSYLGVEKKITDNGEQNNSVFVPDVRNKSLDEAKKILSNMGLNFRIEGNGTKVIEQTPKQDSGVKKGSVIIIYTYKPDKNEMVLVPNLKGRGVDEATRMLQEIGLNIKAVGKGFAVSQGVQPGESISKGNEVEVVFRQAVDD